MPKKTLYQEAADNPESVHNVAGVSVDSTVSRSLDLCAQKYAGRYEKVSMEQVCDFFWNYTPAGRGDVSAFKLWRVRLVMRPDAEVFQKLLKNYSKEANKGQLIHDRKPEDVLRLIYCAAHDNDPAVSPGIKAALIDGVHNALCLAKNEVDPTWERQETQEESEERQHFEWLLEQSKNDLPPFSSKKTIFWSALVTFVVSFLVVGGALFAFQVQLTSFFPIGIAVIAFLSAFVVACLVAVAILLLRPKSSLRCALPGYRYPDMPTADYLSCARGFVNIVMMSMALCGHPCCLKIYNEEMISVAFHKYIRDNIAKLLAKDHINNERDYLAAIEGTKDQLYVTVSQLFKCHFLPQHYDVDGLEAEISMRRVFNTLYKNVFPYNEYVLGKDRPEDIIRTYKSYLQENAWRVLKSCKIHNRRAFREAASKPDSKMRVQLDKAAKEALYKAFPEYRAASTKVDSLLDQLLETVYNERLRDFDNLVLGGKREEITTMLRNDLTHRIRQQDWYPQTEQEDKDYMTRKQWFTDHLKEDKVVLNNKAKSSLFAQYPTEYKTPEREKVVDKMMDAMYRLGGGGFTITIFQKQGKGPRVRVYRIRIRLHGVMPIFVQF